MNPRLHADITQRLDRDFQFKETSGWLRQGTCPDCKKKSLYTHAETPWVIKCERLNKCGAEYHVKELYPELFEKWSERHPVTPENPNAAADAYMAEARGFDLAKVAGWYQQESYYDPALKIGSATVRFALPGGFWERLIDEAHRFGTKKAHFKKGSHYGGTLWMPGNGSVTGKDFWIVEGIFDAIALYHHDISAGSAMSCNNYPETTLKAIAEQCAAAGVARPRLVWALDGDKAGQGFTRQWVKKSREAGWVATAAQIPQKRRGKLDWNDMHQRGRLEPKDLENYLHHGALLIAATPSEKATLLYRRDIGSSFPFEFGSRLYWFKLDLDKFHEACAAIEAENEELTKEQVREKAMEDAHTVTEISTCYPQALYFQQNVVTDESWYYMRVSFPNDTPAIKNTFTASQIASAGDFKKRLLGIAQGAIFTGTTGMLDALWKRQLQGLSRVETIDFTGYSKEHEAYLLGDIAVAKGRLHTVNEEDYFELGKLSVKSLNTSPLHINAKDSEFSTEWVRHLWKSFGPKGIVALAYWFGSLFSEQIRATAKSYPFLEVVGEPGAGKTTLIEFLWKLFGRLDYEGFDPSKSTMAARARNFAQVGGLPIVLIEGDRSDDMKKGGFDWDELKSYYNGRGVRARGMKTSGNETYEPPFRGSIVISQNAPVDGSEAILSRINHLFFDRSGQTPESRVSAEFLERADVESLSGFIVRATLAEGAVVAKFRELAPVCEAALAALDGIRNVRIIKNHAQHMALVACLADVIPLQDHYINAANEHIVEMARERQLAITADHPYVAEFWEVFEYLESEPNPTDADAPTVLNHSRDADVIAINLPHFEQVCTDRKIKTPPILELKRLLRTSRTHKFVDVKTINSRIHERLNRNADFNSSQSPRRPTSVKCWCFEA